MAIDNNLVRFNATSAGLVNFVVASALAGCVTPEAAFATDGKAYVYMARSADGTQFESGKGTYTYAGHVLARTTIYASSSANQKVSFSTVPLVTVFPAPTKLEVGEFLSGTRTVFQQATAPVGWTRDTTFDDALLRIVGSGSPSSGGSNGFSTVNAQTVVGGTTLGINNQALHVHIPAPGFTNIWGDVSGGGAGQGAGSGQSGAPGGTGVNSTTGLSHSHTIVMSIKYVDFIIASKN